MGLLQEIQSGVLQEGTEISPILLKLRFLAARLGSQPLAQWVRHESEGYPKDEPVPDYRILPVSFTGTFSGPFGSGINNAPIAPYLIEKFAGEHWVRHQMRESMAATDDLLASSAKGGGLGINAADLILILNGKVYPDYTCNSISASVARSSLANIRHAVRSRVLELTLELEKSVPEARTIVLGSIGGDPSSTSALTATAISNQIIYGNFTSIVSSGANANISVAVAQGDTEALTKFLGDNGIAPDDAEVLAQIAASEQPGSKDEPMGVKARTWLLENLKKAADGTWKAGLSVATDVIKEGLLRYYGLK